MDLSYFVQNIISSNQLLEMANFTETTSFKAPLCTPKTFGDVMTVYSNVYKNASFLEISVCYLRIVLVVIEYLYLERDILYI